jgi:hypothetical protein
MKPWYVVLKAFKAFMDAMPEMECKTIGYLTADGGGWQKWHCGSCTMHAIRKLVSEAYEFWTADDNHKRAAS